MGLTDTCWFRDSLGDWGGRMQRLGRGKLLQGGVGWDRMGRDEMQWNTTGWDGVGEEG